MTTIEFEKLKKKISDIEKQIIRLQTQKESIIVNWKKEFNISSLAEAEEAIIALQEKKESLLQKQNKIKSQLDDILEAV